MRIRIAIVGAGGHARVVLDVLRLSGLCDVWGFVDDAEGHHGREIDGASVRGPLSLLWDGPCVADAAIVAIGDNAARYRVAARLADHGIHLVTAIHPSAIVAANATIGLGSVVMAGAVVQPGASLGENVIVNTCASVDHDCTVGSFVHLGPGSRLGGHVRIGSGVFLGMGTFALPGVNVGEWSVTGAGSVVVSDLPARVLAYGVPAKVRRTLAPA